MGAPSTEPEPTMCPPSRSASLEFPADGADEAASPAKTNRSDGIRISDLLESLLEDKVSCDVTAATTDTQTSSGENENITAEDTSLEMSAESAASQRDGDEVRSSPASHSSCPPSEVSWFDPADDKEKDQPAPAATDSAPAAAPPVPTHTSLKPPPSRLFPPTSFSSKPLAAPAAAAAANNGSKSPPFQADLSNKTFVSALQQKFAGISIQPPKPSIVDFQDAAHPHADPERPHRGCEAECKNSGSSNGNSSSAAGTNMHNNGGNNESTPRSAGGRLGSEGDDPDVLVEDLYHAPPTHGCGGDLDLTGTWSIQTDAKRLGQLEMEHSSFGHLAGYWQAAPGSSHAAACHGWFWGTTGYIQLALPAPVDDLAHPSDIVQLITLSLNGQSNDSSSGAVNVVLDGDLRCQKDQHDADRPDSDDTSTEGVEAAGKPGKNRKVEIVIRPKIYRGLRFGDQKTCDLVLDVHGSQFHVHTAVVTTFMPHLRTVLNAGMQEFATDIIPCPGDSPHAWRVLIERIYDITGCFHASAALKVLPLLDKYQVPKLWSEAMAELKRLPQIPRPHPHVLDLLCRCDATEVIEHWFQQCPPDADELALFVRECSEIEATRIVSQKAAEKWRKDATDLTSQIHEAKLASRTLQRHIDAIRHVVSTHVAPASAWGRQTVVVPDFYISSNLPPISTSQTPHYTEAPRPTPLSMSS
ncbi:hypothetical protein DIPPA_33745 [Diplonema papillatum]|nr:hypothetical protein DIPPA_33745 [Diplonema papillatum]